MSNHRSATWSNVLLTAGALVLFLTGLVGFLNAAVVNGENFAAILNDVRQDPTVKAEVGAAIATAAIDAQPDLIAIEPAIAAGAGAVVGSPLIDGVFTRAVSSFHAALTVEGADSAVLGLADLGATVTTALERFVPQAAEVIPPNLNLTLAEIGGQEGIAAQIIPIVQVVSTLAWLLPLVALSLLAGGMWLAPRRRMALVRMGWMLVIVGGFLGLAVVGMNVAGALIDDSTLQGAVAAAALVEFSKPLALRFIATVVVGGLLVATAGALLPQVAPEQYVRRAVDLILRRPASTGWAIVRAMAVIGLGALMVLNPTLTAQAVAIVAGLAVFLHGVAELDVVAERARAADLAHREALGTRADASPVRRPAALWLIPLGAGLAAVLVLTALIVPDHLPQDEGLQTVAVDTDACNGHIELCDRPFDQVMVAATHNSMSVADGTWFLAEQPTDMVESLDDGIRGLLVDTWYAEPTADGRAITSDKSLAAAEAELRATYGPEVVGSIRRTIDRVRRSEPVGPPEPYFCHTVCEIGSARMLPVMDRLSTWLDDHPRDVVVLFIQDTVTPSDTAAVLQRAGLVQRAYVHPEGAPWPTLRQMIEADTRLLVLMENTGGGDQYPYLHQGFDLVQDTEYTFASVEDFTCTLERGTPDSPLLSVNHWLSGFSKLVSNADLANAYDVLKPRIEQCVQQRGRVPWMVAVNWYDRGDLFRVVDEYNGVGG